MTIDHIYNIVVDAMNKLEDIDFINLDKRKYNQQQVNEAYKILDNFKDELIREKNKQEAQMNIYGIYDTKNNEQCMRVGTLQEIVKFLNLTAREMSRAIKKNDTVRNHYKIYYLFNEEVH